MTQSNTCLFATVLCLIPENVYGQKKNTKTGNGLAAGCHLFYRKIYGYFLRCKKAGYSMGFACDVTNVVFPGKV